MALKLRAFGLLAVTAAVAALSAASACSSGSVHHTLATPTPATPQNVAAVGGFNTVHVTWSVVSGATGYRVYASELPIVTTSGMVGTFVNAPPYDAGGVSNWVELHIRVTALHDALESLPSQEVTATPNAGWIVSSHNSSGTLSLDWFKADDTNVLTDSIPGGQLLTGGLIGNTAGIYAVSNPAQTAYTEIGLAFGAGHFAYANAAGHTYQWVQSGTGLLAGSPPRVILADKDTGTGLIALRSYALTGGDERTLTAGCSVVGNYLLNEFGILYQCDIGAFMLWHSDGVATGFHLPENTQAPVGLTATRALFQEGQFPYQAITQRFDSTPPSALYSGNSPSEILGVGSNRVLVQYTSGATYGRWTYDFDGSHGAPQAGPDTPRYTPMGTTEDGSAELLLGSGGEVMLAWFSPLRDVFTTNECIGCTADQTYLIAGKKVLSRTSIGWLMVDRETGLNFVNLLSSSGTMELVGQQPGWVLLYEPGSTTLDLFSTTDGTRQVLSTSALAVLPLFYPDDTVIWLDLDGTTHLARAGLGGIPPMQIDTTTATLLVDGGMGSNDRLFYSARRNSIETQVMLWDGSAPDPYLVAGDLGVSDTGYYFAK